MRNSLSPLAALALAAPLLAPSARAAFDDDFSLVSPSTPAGYYTFASGVPALGQWSVGFFPSDTGQSHVDTAAAPASVSFGASAIGEMCAVEESTTVLFIDLPVDGHVSFTIQVANTGSGDFYAGAEIYLSGVVLYALTDRIEQRVLEGFRDELGDGVADLHLIRAVRVLQGDPPTVILEETQKLGVDLLVVGSHSHGAELAVPLGRTAARLLQLSEVPVYLVPMLQHRGHGEL